MDATKWTQGFQEMINLKPMEQIIPNTNTNNTQQQQQTFISSTTTTTTTRPNTTASNGISGAGNIIINNNNNNNTAGAATTMESRKARPQEKVNCPRCNSTNTKFCYYNNYSLTQPRYFCKGCRRYWTEGGSLRNVPVGGSSRKNKRSSSTPLASSHSKLPDLNPPILFSNHHQIPNKSSSSASSKDLNLLSFPVMQDHHHHHGMSQFLHMPKIENPNNNTSALELLRSSSSRGMNMNTSFLPAGGHHQQMMDSNSMFYSSLGFPTMVDHYKQSNLSFSIDQNAINGNQRGDQDSNNDHHHGNNDMNGGAASRVLFPFSDMKELSSTTQEKSHGGNNNSNAYWNGMFSTTGGSSW